MPFLTAISVFMMEDVADDTGMGATMGIAGTLETLVPPERVPFICIIELE